MSNTLMTVASLGLENVSPILGAVDPNLGNTWLDSLRTFLVPFLLIAVAGISVTFLVRRQMSQFLQFILISVLVFVLIYSPEIISSIASFLSDEATKEGTGITAPSAPAK